MENLNLPKVEYYAVNDRPVKIVPTANGGGTVLVMNWETGKFESDMSYLSRCYDPDQDVDQFSEQSFNQYVEELRREIVNSNNTQ